MENPIFLAGRSSYAKRRRSKRLGICVCGSIMHNINNCRRSSLSASKSDRLDWVKYGRVVLEDETRINSSIVRLVAHEYRLVDLQNKIDDNRCEPPKHPSRSPEETPEYYSW
uniref:Nucleic acid binding protein n=1 Tax=Grapevine virus H TaxID=2045345 RepID=A0A4D6E9F5_9VIRU|nr:nucleic acid binding protein [Grapevine virus H]